MKHTGTTYLLAIALLAAGCVPSDDSAEDSDANNTSGAPALTCADVDRDADAEAPPTNEAEITLSGTYRVDGRWVLDSDEDVTIEAGTVFIMGPSAEVLFGWRNDPASIFADGTADAPILFCGAQERPGFWTGLEFLGGVETDSYLKHVRIEDAGKDDYAALAIDTGVLLQHVTATNNAAAGFDLTGLAQGSSALTSTANGAPAKLNSHSAITNFPAGEYTGNETDVIDVSGFQNDNVVFHDRGVPYRQTGERVVFGPADGGESSITFEAGVEYRFCQDCFMNIGWRNDNGSIYANGTAESPVVFTSSRDEPQPGDWNGIFLLGGTTSDSIIEFAEFRYGGKAGAANLIVDGGNGTITDSLFADSLGAGLLVDRAGDSLTIRDNNRFENNQGGDLVQP